MPIDLSILVRQLPPEDTVLVLGAGSSIPSGAPSGSELTRDIKDKFGVAQDYTLNLSDVATLVESRYDRRSLIEFVNNRLVNLQPSGGLLSLPLLNWAAIFSTNYDELVEKSYKRLNLPITVFSSNFDFKSSGENNSQNLYKFHGTLGKDISLGHLESMILTASDYDRTSQYRQLLYSRLTDLMFSKSVLIIGNSLADPDLRKIVDDAINTKATQGAPGRIYLCLHEDNKDLIEIYKSRGISICVAGIDELLHQYIKNSPDRKEVFTVSGDILDGFPSIISTIIDVRREFQNDRGNLIKMFNGKPATYGDVENKRVFDRDIVADLETQLIKEDGESYALILGSAGVGKTTAVRLLFKYLDARNYHCWEHKNDYEVDISEWCNINDKLVETGEKGVLFIDDAHEHLKEINKLIEKLSLRIERNLFIVLSSSKPHWNPRIKTPHLFQSCKIYELSRLSETELINLLDLLDSNSDIKKLVENKFLGFNRFQRMERLKDRCDSDMFVCLKNIFGFDSIDSILLEEFKLLNADLQDIYKYVAGMESIGVRVHRELVRRIIGIQANQVSRVLEDLDGIIEEYEIRSRDGIYGWKVRHGLIASTIANYKFHQSVDIFDLFDLVVTKLNPTYPLEVQSISAMCSLGNGNSGIGKITDASSQNIILRKMINLAPKEKVPRHRLIHNLISLGEFESADSEIRFYEKELRRDSATIRYKARLKLAFAKSAKGLTSEDQGAIVLDAISILENGIESYPEDKSLYRVLLDGGISYYKITKDTNKFAEAFMAAYRAQSEILDPDLRRILLKYIKIADAIGVKLELDW